MQLIIRLVTALALSLALPTQGALAQQVVAERSEAGSERVRARVVPLDEARLSAATEALVEQIHVHEGERFERGDLLVSLNCRVTEARLAEARVELESAKKNRTARERLAETRSVGALELELARISVRQVQASMETIQAELDRCRIVAPFDGIVSKVHFNEAEFVRMGEPLIEVLNDTRLEAEFLVPSRWLPRLAVGDRLEIDADELNRPIAGSIKRLGVTVNPVSRSLLVVAELSDVQDGVRVGTSGSVRFVTD